MNLVYLKSLLYLSDYCWVAISEERINLYLKREKNQQNNSMEDIQDFIALLFYTYPKKDYQILTAVTQDGND